MKILAVSVLALFCPFVAIQQASAGPNDLSVIGTDFNLGVFAGTTTPGSTFRYTDASAESISGSLWWSHRPLHEWTFMHAGVTTERWVMKLASDHSLNLYVDSPGNTTPAITLWPGGISKMTQPIGALAYNDSILNVLLGDSRYVRLSDGGSIAAGGIAIGTNNTVISTALAFGAENHAYTSGGVAIGTGNWVGNGGLAGVAIGNGNVASGSYAFGEGYQSKASGYASIALGSSVASGWYSTALGFANTSGAHAFAVGYATVSGGFSIGSGFSWVEGGYSAAFGNSKVLGAGSYYATAGGASEVSAQYGTAFGLSKTFASGDTALGNSSASNDRSVALGNGTATGAGSTASGYSMAYGDGSTASGFTTASGAYATSFGQENLASGNNSTALGYKTTAAGYAQVVIGQYNIPSGTAATLAETDNLFIIGNGTNALTSNALEVKKNGETTIKGKLNVGQQCLRLSNQQSNRAAPFKACI